MRVHNYLLAALAIVTSGLVFATPAAAQATRTWVSGVGDDANPCSRTAPCKTFAGALSKTAAAGEINCIDAGAYGAVSIGKSITIRCDDVEAGVLGNVSVPNTITINAAATDVVTLSGLDIEGTGTASNGIRIFRAAAVHIQNVTVHGFRGGGATDGNGILFAPSDANSELVITNTYISDNGTPAIGGGIVIKPTGTGSAKVTIDGVIVANSNLGIRADGTGNAGAQVSIVNTTVGGNTNGGIASFSPVAGPAVAVMVSDSNISENGVGINGNGANAVLRIGSSVLSHNATAVVIQNGATVTSYGNNQIDDNAAAGPVLPVAGLK